MRTTLALVFVTAALAFTGCKKKADEASAAKPVEGSAAPAASATPAAGSSAAEAPKAEAPKAEPAAKVTADILETAKGAGNLTTFLKTVEAAGLNATFAGAGPFTVFAPTDDVFAKIPAKDLEALLADKPKLEALLQFHVVAGNVASTDLAGQKAVKSLQGGELAVDATSGVKISGATIVKADLAASNGVIHTIDTVLQLPAK